MLLGQEKGHSCQIQHSLKKYSERPTSAECEMKILFSLARKVLIFLNYPKCDNSLVLKHTQKLCLAFLGFRAVSTVELPSLKRRVL